MRRRLASWLFVCAALVWATLVVGGITRLTQSGLSIVEWQPLAGALPPLDDGDWHALFAKYRQTPESRLVNPDFSLDQFKGIFWWEYAHRLLGRVDGLVFFLPFVWFAGRGAIGRALALKLAGIFLLGAAQGALGWYMVQSGLVDDPRVSPYRLAAHLALAFALFGALLWTALDLLAPRARAAPGSRSLPLRRAAALLALLVFVMAVSGALVAGLHAGRIYGSFPLMEGYWVPPGLFALEPWYDNPFRNPVTAQFDHRLGAWLLILLVPVFAWRLRRARPSSRTRAAAAAMLVAFALQLALGIATLLLAVPPVLAALHQANAMIFFGVLVWLNHELRVAALPGASGAASG